MTDKQKWIEKEYKKYNFWPVITLDDGRVIRCEKDLQKEPAQGN